MRVSHRESGDSRGEGLCFAGIVVSGLHAEGAKGAEIAEKRFSVGSCSVLSGFLISSVPSYKWNT